MPKVLIVDDEPIAKPRQKNAILKILAISGGGKARNRDGLDSAIELGADAALAKPFTNTESLAEVERCVNA